MLSLDAIGTKNLVPFGMTEELVGAYEARGISQTITPHEDFQWLISVRSGASGMTPL